jgi:hypothetical protein
MPTARRRVSALRRIIGNDGSSIPKFDLKLQSKLPRSLVDLCDDEANAT